MSKNTSWGNVAEWYSNYLEGSKDSYQERVIAPNLLRVLSLKQDEKLLDVACGQGFFSRKFSDAGAAVTGADISPELIAEAKKRSSSISYHVTPAHKLSFATDGSFETATIVLAVQNIENIQEVFTEISRTLVSGGRLLIVMNHPAFRIPERSSWGYDEQKKIRYRRVDGYLSTDQTKIILHPGQKKSEATISYHRSLQDFFRCLRKAGFNVSQLEEWVSHKRSEAGPRQKAEDTARKEIPLFLMLEAKKIR